MKAQETVDFPIRWVWAKISRMYNAEASKFGGTMSMGYILLNIDREGTPSTSLGPKMGMEPTSLTRILKRMEEKGLIKREQDVQDKRKVLIFLTTEGKKLRKVSKQVVIRFNEAIQSKIPKKKLNVFNEVIQDLNLILDKNNIFD